MPVKLVAAVGFAAALICVPADASEAASPPARVALPTSAGGDAGLKPGVFLPIGDQGAFRLDGVRVGQHRGVPVRFLDITLKNAVAGVTLAYPQARPALAKRVLTWRDLTLAADDTAP